MNEKDIGVSVVIPNWNGKELLEKNLPTVITAKSNTKNKIQEIVIVDDKSSDDSVKFLEKEYKDKIRLIKHTKNRGFAKAVNMGVRMSKGNLVCLLNSDVAVTQDFLVSSLTHFSDDDLFGVSLNEAENKYSGYAIGKFENGFVVHEGSKTSNKVHPTFWLSGGSSIVRRDIWIQLKGFDRELFYPYYWEDIDISYRAMKRGYRLLWDPKAKVYHEHESTISKVRESAKRKDIIKQRGQLLFIWKNLTSNNLFKKHIRGLIKHTLTHPGYVQVVFSALKKLKTVRQKRKTEKKESKVADEAIFQSFVK